MIENAGRIIECLGSHHPETLAKRILNSTLEIVGEDIFSMGEKEFYLRIIIGARPSNTGCR
jgi:hypothetical protein